jgi:hypothetical protein
MEESASTREVAKEEATRQAIGLVSTVVGAVVYVVVLRTMANPDWFRTLKMRAALVVKRALSIVDKKADEVYQSGRWEQ